MIHIQVTNQDWTPSAQFTKKEEYKGVDWLKFEGFLCRRFVVDTVLAVKRQSYVLHWRPLNLVYLRYKHTHGLSTNIWEATGTLISSLNYWKRGNVWTIGFNRRRFYPGTRISLLFVARCLEFGAKRIPARPIFRRTHSYLESNTEKYLEAFVRGRGF